MELKNGLYIECKFDKISTDMLFKAYKDVGIGNLVDASDAHCTICYSKALPEGEFNLKELKGVVIPDKLTIFPKGESGYPLVLKLKSNVLHDQHKFYNKKYKLSYDYPEYIPHITISYCAEKALGIKIDPDAGTETIEKLLNSLVISLPKSLKIVAQNYNDLDPDWAAKVSDE